MYVLPVKVKTKSYERKNEVKYFKVCYSLVSAYTYYSTAHCIGKSNYSLEYIILHSPNTILLR